MRELIWFHIPSNEIILHLGLILSLMVSYMIWWYVQDDFTLYNIVSQSTICGHTAQYRTHKNGTSHHELFFFGKCKILFLLFSRNKKCNSRKKESPSLAQSFSQLPWKLSELIIRKLLKFSYEGSFYYIFYFNIPGLFLRLHWLSFSHLAYNAMFLHFVRLWFTYISFMSVCVWWYCDKRRIVHQNFIPYSYYE